MAETPNDTGSKGLFTPSTVVGVVAVAIGLVLVAAGGGAGSFAGALLLAIGGIDLALDFERSLVPPRPLEVRAQGAEPVDRTPETV